MQHGKVETREGRKQARQEARSGPERWKEEEAVSLVPCVRNETAEAVERTLTILLKEVIWWCFEWKDGVEAIRDGEEDGRRLVRPLTRQRSAEPSRQRESGRFLVPLGGHRPAD